MTYRLDRPRHPVNVAEMSDAATLIRLADRVDAELDYMICAGARAGCINAVTILRGAAKALGQ
jgi:hypothetical protein